MTRTKLILSAALFFQTGGQSFSQEGRPVYHGSNYVTIRPGETAGQILEKAAGVTPSANQLEWQRIGFAGFIHFGINTFTGKEWGDGKDDPRLFNPSKLDAGQWVRVMSDAGMKLVIITARHHDGFCLWPSKYTDYTVAASPWKQGKGDVVGAVAAACREYGLKFGVYLSPWDRHEPSYGEGDKYDRYFLDQLRELLTGYGEVSEVWFDGACGEGANGKKQEYNWKSYYAMIRELQPKAVIAIMGPDVRWVGTETGYGRETEWSVIPDRIRDPDSAAMSEREYPVDEGFIPGDLTTADLGSPNRLTDARSLIWYPAETDVSIRPGWFFHPEENNKVKTPEKLVEIYFHSVGMNSGLLMNVPPDRHGLIHKKDIRSLTAMKKILDRIFRNNLLDGAASSYRNGIVEYTLPEPVTFNVAMVCEDIKVGQRIAQFHLEAWDGSTWNRIAGGTTVGNKRLLRFSEVNASKIRFVVDSTRGEPAILDIGLYRDGRD